MRAEGLLLVAAGLGLLWSARTNADHVAAINRRNVERMRERGWPRWAVALLAPPWNRSQRGLRAGNTLIATSVLAAGLLNVAGVWAF